MGFRDKNGILQELKELETKEIPNEVKRMGHGTWDGNLCINFTATFLDCMIVRLLFYNISADVLQGSNRRLRARVSGESDAGRNHP